MSNEEIISQYNNITALVKQLDIQTDRFRNMLEGAGILSNARKGKRKDEIIVRVLTKRGILKSKNRTNGHI